MPLSAIPQLPPLTGAPAVAILLGTYNGAGFLAEQLNSFAAQTYGDWKLWASDDGSSDGTRDLLRAYQDVWGEDRLSILKGPQRGFVANFMALARNSAIRARAFAFSDQDDVWEADKLHRAMAWLDSTPTDAPALYMTRTRLIDDAGKDLGFAPLFTNRAPTFANAMVQNIGGGNTMVYNEAANRLMISIAADVPLVSHDWWAYIVVTGAGGQAFYDPYPSVRYRQHGGNVVGSNAGLLARLWRAALVFGGRFKHWSAVNTGAVAHFRDRLTPENRRIFDHFCAAREGWLPSRLWALKRSGVHRQGFIDNIGLYVAALFHRL